MMDKRQSEKNRREREGGQEGGKGDEKKKAKGGKNHFPIPNP